MLNNPYNSIIIYNTKQLTSKKKGSLNCFLYDSNKLLREDSFIIKIFNAFLEELFSMHVDIH